MDELENVNVGDVVHCYPSGRQILIDEAESHEQVAWRVESVSNNGVALRTLEFGGNCVMWLDVRQIDMVDLQAYHVWRFVYSCYTPAELLAL